MSSDINMDNVLIIGVFFSVMNAETGLKFSQKERFYCE